MVDRGGPRSLGCKHSTRLEVLRSLSLSLSFSLYLSLCEKSLEMKKRKKTVSAARNPKNVTMSLVKPVMNNIGAAGGTTAWAAAARATSAAGLPWRTGAARAAGCGEALRDAAN